MDNLGTKMLAAKVAAMYSSVGSMHRKATRQKCKIGSYDCPGLDLV